MKKLLIGLICIVNINAFASSDYANIYADELIKQFDTSLDMGIINKEVYRKILATRIYLTKNNYEINEKSLLLIKNSSYYVKTVQEINKMANNINIVENTSSANVIYPSVEKNGNISGYKYPKNVWSLTFDDGPHPTRTQLVIDNLYERAIPATFFVLSRLAKKFPQIIDQMVDAKLEVSNHSHSHKNLVKVSASKLKEEIHHSKTMIEEVLNEKINLFRLPYGSGLRNSKVRESIADSNQIHVFWNIDSLDWKDKDPRKIFNRVKKLMSLTSNKGGIILFHDIHYQSVLASEMVMDYLIEQNKIVCSVGVVVDYLNQKDQDCI